MDLNESPRNIFDLIGDSSSDCSSINTLGACDNCGVEVNQSKDDASYCEECCGIFCKRCSKRVLVHNVAEGYYICKYCVLNKD